MKDPQTCSRDEPEVARDFRDGTLRVTILSAMIGTAVEWYDFYLYATASAVVFNRLFFPSYSATIGTLLSFCTLAVGFFVRPLGALVFGKLGDRIGRKRVLVITLLMMGGSTTAMGLLPTYARVGILAPILLTLLRMVQGFGSGAEYAGAVLMIVETAPPERRGFYGSLPYIGVAAGLMLSVQSLSWASKISGSAFEFWAWRLPFLFSALVVVVGLILRSRLPETPVFERVRKSDTLSESPVMDVFRCARREIFCAWGARMGDNSLAYIYESFVIAYATQNLNIPRSLIMGALAFSAFAQFATIPFFGWLSDKVGRRPVYFGGAALSAAFVFPFFAILRSRSGLAIYAALLFVSAVCKIMMTSAQSSWFAEMFPAKLRYTGFTLAREVTSPLSGGIAPLVATALLAAGHGSFRFVAWYVIALSCITMLSVSLGPETRGRDLRI